MAQQNGFAQLLSWLAEMFSEHVEGVAVVDPAD
jgi:hypothetical protein